MTWDSISKQISQIGKWLLPASGLVYVVSLFFPWISGPPTSIDASWEMALHRATEQHLQFGHDIIFTFGPWGILYSGYYPATFLMCASLWMLLALMFWWAGWRVANHFSSNQLVAWIWFMIFAGLAGMRIEQSVDVRVTGWALVLLALYFFVEEKAFSARQSLLAIGAGMLALVKFTCFIEFSVVILVIGADIILRRRRFPWIALVYIISILFFWLIAGQHLSRLGSYLNYSVMLARGYIPAMMLSGESETITLAGMLVAMTVLIILTGYIAWKQRQFYSILPLAGLGGVLFLIFKLGCVRYHPIHGITTTLQLLLAALICLAVAWPVLKRQQWWICGMVCTAMAGIYLFSSFTFNRCYREQGFPDERLWVSYAWTLNFHNLTVPMRLLRDPKYLQKIYRENFGEIRNAFPLPLLQGSVDVYPWRQVVIFSHDLRYNPRPVIQSYSAYTLELARLNALHLKGDHAPDNVLFDIEPQNNNYPSLEDGFSWPELLTRYDIAGTTDRFVILKKSMQPRDYHLTLLTNTLVAMGNPVAIATNQGLIWAEMEIHPTFRGSVASIFYKPQRLLLAVSLNGGEQRYFNLVPGMVQGGFLLSPLIQDKASFISMAKGGASQDLAGLQVTSVAIILASPDGSCFDYQLPVRWRLYRLDFPPQKLD